MSTLLRRELAEHRLLFLYTPLACMVMYVVWLVARMADYSGEPVGAGLRPNGVPHLSGVNEARRVAALRTIYILSELFRFAGGLLTLFWVSMAFYFLYTLYQQRKDRSVLFWSSLPVSVTQTVVSKLLAGLVGCHIVYLLVIMVSELLTPVVVWLYSAVLGIDTWDPYLEQAWSLTFMVQPERALYYLRMVPMNALWSLPAYAWLLLASASSRRAPFAWAVGPWLLVVIVELAIRERSWFLDTLVRHLFPASYAAPSIRMPPLDLAIGVLLGATFVYAAIRLNRPDDT